MEGGFELNDYTDAGAKLLDASSLMADWMFSWET